MRWSILGVVVAGASCAHYAGRHAAEGALEKVAEATDVPPGQRPGEVLGDHAVLGAVERLSAPTQVAVLRRVAADVASAAVDQSLDTAMAPTRAGGESRIQLLASQAAQGLREGLMRELPAEARAGGAAAIDGAMTRLLPECRADDPRCIDRRLRDLTDAAARGFGDGLRASLGLPTLLLAFAAGACLTGLGVLIAGWLRQRRDRLSLEPTPAAGQ